jgi:wobble nucleotide-excising tRNase
MLLKINHIKNVGRFYEVVPKGTPESSCTLERFNLLYADNGTGKTTLGAIIKSLAFNEPDRILSRKTISGTGPCEASLQVDDQQCNFLNDVWKKSPDSKFAIFDEEFIEKNIFSTAGVGTDHKRQLYNYVVLGEENVDKARELQALTDDQIPALTKDITALEAQLKTASGVADMKALLEMKPLSAEDFAKLQADVTAKDTQIRNSERIKTHKALDKLPVVAWPNYAPSLAQGLDEIGNIEEYKIHIQTHQKWLKDGLDIQKDSEECPYCFQDVKGNEAILAYKQFFSAQCQALMNQVAGLATEVSTSLSHDKALLMEKIVSGNNESSIFWQTMDNTIPAALPFAENYAARIKEYHDALARLVDQKQKNILSPVQLTEADKAILKTAEELTSAITAYNKAVDAANVKIAAIKGQHVTLDDLKQQHAANAAILKAQQAAFHNDITKQTLVRYRALIKDKQTKTERLNALRTELSETSVKLLENYQASINKLLKNFGVEFSINKVERKSDTARKETLTFAIELKGMTFDPNGGSKTPYSLTNTLSSGDKSTLAFALFLAKLQHTNLSNTVVVFDDPISSLDFFRKQQTSKQINALSANAKQTIVLTHSMEFTRLFGHVPVKAKYFKLFKVDSLAGVVLTPYDKLSDMCVSKHYDEHEAITTYLTAPQTVKRLDVMKSIRSYVETKLCTYMPELKALNPPNLGTFIKHLRQKQIDTAYIADLELINDSIVIENHGGDPTADDHSNLTDDELRNLCKLALAVSAPAIL